MAKQKFNPELLKEELNRFKQINGYNFQNENHFYATEQKAPVYGYNKPVILGGDDEIKEADENPEDAVDAISNDLGLDANADGGEQPAPDAPAPDAPAPDAPAPDAPAPDAPAPVEPEMPVSDDVEVDVTELVTGSEEAKAAADKASQNSEMLLQKLDALEARIANMDRVSAKIDSLEQEMVKRNPTPAEKLDLQSLHSGPYTQKLSDYWANKEGAYDVMGNGNKQEYTLTKDDIDADYSDTDIKKSFAVNPEDEYEEEDIY